MERFNKYHAALVCKPRVSEGRLRNWVCEKILKERFFYTTGKSEEGVIPSRCGFCFVVCVPLFFQRGGGSMARTANPNPGRAKFREVLTFNPELARKK